MHDYHPCTPEINYVQDENNTCVLSSLSSTLFAANYYVA